VKGSYSYQDPIAENEEFASGFLYNEKPQPATYNLMTDYAVEKSGSFLKKSF
jgi:hypothetical protein